jgi:hypothetical protein
VWLPGCAAAACSTSRASDLQASAMAAVIAPV